MSRCISPHSTTDITMKKAKCCILLFSMEMTGRAAIVGNGTINGGKFLEKPATEFVISTELPRSRRDSVGGGGVVAEFSRYRHKPTRFSGEGGGVVVGIFRYLQLRNQIFTPHSVIFVGRDTHWKIKDHSNCPNSVRFFYISVRPGNQE